MSLMEGLLRGKFVREFGWLSLSNQISVASALVSMILLTRMESLTTVGHVAFAQAVAGVVLLIVDIRFEDALQRYFPILKNERGRQSAELFFWRMCRWDVLLGLCIGSLAIGALAAGAFPSNGSWVPSYVAIALVTAGLGTVLGSLNSGFAVTGQLSQLARVSIAAVVATAIVTIGGLIIYGAIGYLVGALAGTVFQVLLAARAVRRHIPYPRDAGRIPAPRGLGRFLLKSSAASSLAVGSESGVLMIGGVIGSPELVAFLKVAQAPARAITALFSPLTVQMFPLLAQCAARGDESGVRRLTTVITRRVSAAALVACIVATLVLEPAIGAVYGDAFAIIWLGALLLLVAASLRAAVAWSKVLPLAIGRPGLRLIVLAVESIVLLGAAYLAAHENTAIDGVIYFSVAAVGLAALSTSYWLAFVRRRSGLVSDTTKEPNNG